MMSSPMDDPLDRTAILERASAGLALIAARGVATRVIGLLGFVVLAGVFGPRDFGLLALGITFLTLAGFFSDFGLGAALLRGRVAPSTEVFEAMLGFQLLVSSAVAVMGVATAVVVGHGALITAVMVSSLPLFVLRGPPSITLERQLRYRELAMVDVLETLVYTFGSIAVALAGAGPLGVAIVFWARPLVGLRILLRAADMRMCRPRLDFGTIRPVFGFGWRLGAIHFVSLGRDQSYAVGTSAISGLNTLGLWNLVSRVLVVPSVMLDAVNRVAFPTISRLIERGEDVRGQIKLAVPITTLVLGLILVPIVTAGPNLLPSVLGPEWRPSADILRWACAALLVGAPLAYVTGGYFLAVGDASTPLRVGIVDSSVTVVTGLGSLPLLGPQALGLGMLCGACANALLLGRALKARVGMSSSFFQMLPPALLTIAVASAGWLAASETPQSIAVGAGITVGSMVVFVVLSRILLTGLTAEFLRVVFRPSWAQVRRRQALPTT
jgi:O-antigen/teichoic acid export membrane protein